MDLENAMATIESLKTELNSVKFANTVLKEENERLNALYQVSKSTEHYSQGLDDGFPSPKRPSSPKLSRDEYNWGTIIKMYEKQLIALRAERDALKSGVRAPEPALQLPFNLGYDEITEAHNEGFSKKFVKIARQAVLVALKKETDLFQASTSIVDYLRETRRSQNWLCSFTRASERVHMRCH